MNVAGKFFLGLKKMVTVFGHALWQINPLAAIMRRPFCVLILLALLCNLLAFGYDPNKNLSVQISHWTWYLDWRFWPEWMTKICWLLPWWTLAIILINLVFSPRSRRFYLRPRLYRWIAHFVLLYFIDSIWRTATKTPVSFYWNVVSNLYKNHAFVFHVVMGTLLFIALGIVLWRFRRRRKLTRIDHVSTCVLFLVIILLGSTVSSTVYSQPPTSEKPNVSPSPKKTTSSSPVTKPKVAAPVKVTPPKPKPVYKYKIQSREELEQLTDKQIKELVAEENRFERRGDKKQLDGPMVHIFDEKEFVCNAGKYENATIKYRLFSPLKITPNKKYPLVIYLHGIGEAGNDNAYPLLYLNNLLPLMVGADKEDFYMLVLQCPKDNKGWNFKSTKDGTLDVLDTLIDKLIGELPIEPRQLSLFGLSSGGFGVWLYAQQYPEKFAAVCPAPGNPPAITSNIRQLVNTRIWSFRGKNDKSIPAEPIQKIVDYLNASGGYAKLTEIEKRGHDAWMPAMRQYDCFRWMIKQKQESWFAPLPDRPSYKTWSASESWQKFLMPLAIAVGMLLVSGMPLFQTGCEYFQRRVLRYGYSKINVGDQYEEEPSEEIQPEEPGQQITSEEGEISQTEEISSTDTSQTEKQELVSNNDDYRIWTDASGSKKIQAKLVGFEKGMIIIELSNGKQMRAKAQIFSQEDIAYLKEKWKEFKEKEQK